MGTIKILYESKQTQGLNQSKNLGYYNFLDYNKEGETKTFHQAFIRAF